MKDSEGILTPEHLLIAIASKTEVLSESHLVIDKEDYKSLADLILQEKEFEFEE